MSHDPYFDQQQQEALSAWATDRLREEWEDMSTERVLNFLSSLELADVAYRTYHGESGALTEELDRLEERFIDLYLQSEIEILEEEGKMEAAESYADYLEGR